MTVPISKQISAVNYLSDAIINSSLSASLFNAGADKSATAEPVPNHLMSSQKGEDEYLTFTGKNAEEAEDFIHAVNRRAWATGKLDDDAWTAKFAYVCFTKKALRWYEELDKETRNDWTLLRQAILAKYATPPLSPSVVPSSAPAAAR
ncbi:hypothetical protein FRC00_008404 [Tulasnella sp. 408]|nr:hypothetical protein FRC00_008404 [Tulasnella sp. 408]